MRVAARLFTVPGLIMIVLVSAFTPMQAIAQNSVKSTGENHASSVMAGSGTVHKQLDHAWQPQYDVRPDWIDYDGIEQLSYAMGILLYDTVDEVNLSIEHIAQGMESQRRLKRKLGSSLISVAQAQSIVREHEKHQIASAERFIKHWKEKFSEKENTNYREVTAVKCDSLDKADTAGIATIKKHFQYLLADGWNNSFPVELPGANEESLKSIFCNKNRPSTQHWKVSEFESNDELIDGLSELSEEKGVLPGSVYDVVIPSSKAYGDKGLAGVVMPHSVVRMLIRPYVPKQSN